MEKFASMHLFCLSEKENNLSFTAAIALGISKGENKTILRCLHEGWGEGETFQMCFYLVFTLIHIIGPEVLWVLGTR